MYVISESEIKAEALPGRKHKMIVSPWHFGKSKRMCFGMAEFPPNSHAPIHIHKKEEEIIYFMSGFGQMFFNNKHELIRKGCVAFIPPNVRHSIKNESNEIMKLIYIFSPPVKQGSYDK